MIVYVRSMLPPWSWEVCLQMPCPAAGPGAPTSSPQANHDSCPMIWFHPGKKNLTHHRNPYIIFVLLRIQVAVPLQFLPSDPFLRDDVMVEKRRAWKMKNNSCFERAPTNKNTIYIDRQFVTNDTSTIYIWKYCLYRWMNHSVNWLIRRISIQSSPNPLHANTENQPAIPLYTKELNLLWNETNIVLCFWWANSFCWRSS